MLQIHSDIGERFEAAMQSASIAEHLRPHFRRWLRFYLDFCAKYGFDANAGSSFQKFNAKDTSVRHTIPSVTIKEAKSPLDL